MNIWFTADTHFGNPSIAKLCPQRYNSQGEYTDEIMIACWNANVKKNDIVFVLGDFCFAKEPTQYIKKLNGCIKLITGNHDEFLKPRYYNTWSKQQIYHELHKGDNLKFEILPQYYELKYNKTKFVLCHYPIQYWNGQSNGSIHLYGHVHGACKVPGKALDVGVDTIWNNHSVLTPYSIDEVLVIIGKYDKIEHPLVEKYYDYLSTGYRS